MFALIAKPFPMNTWSWYKQRGIGFGLFIFLFLFLFKPFYLHLLETGKLLSMAACYGLITALVIIGGGLVFTRWISPRINEEKWTLGKQVLLNMVLMICIAFFNVFITQLIYGMPIDFSWYGSMLQWVVMIGTLPIAIAELVSYNYYLRKNLESASELTRIARLPYKEPVKVLRPLVLQEPAPAYAGLDFTATADILNTDETPLSEPVLELTGENQADRLIIQPQQLLAVQALDNYVNIFWAGDDRLQTTLLRNTLTNIAEQLNAQPQMYRSHRGWLVNSTRVREVEGNAQGLKLTIDLMEQPVPVSRANIAGYRLLTQEQHILVQN
ncbi:LytTR family transcriptional regulator DNA-binding domain-containing protein [Terrimonas rubra]|uniref:LytTR family transcriptional regulator DNA-binding domain-containing protein n=1 Tax=Terrimonas rubra TaxID=1035890 RepID=A0ABW6A6R4_9BACT